MPEFYELVNTYKPDIIWADGHNAGDNNWWKAKEFIAWLYNESPVKERVVVNDRWDLSVKCHKGDFITCKDRYNPRKIIEKKWENCFPIDKISWGYRRQATVEEHLTIHEIITFIAQTVR